MFVSFNLLCSLASSLHYSNAHIMPAVCCNPCVTNESILQEDKSSFDAYQLEPCSALLSISSDQTEPIPCMAQELELQARQLEEQHSMQLHDR